MNHSISTMTGKTKIKIVFLGSQNVGKSSIIERYVNNRFEEAANPTVGIDFLAKNITHNAKSYRMQLWDTAGQERFRSLIPSYLKDAHSALIVFDVSSKLSFAQVPMWAKLFQQNKSGEGTMFLVGNKTDLQFRQISFQVGKERAVQMGMEYFQISAKTGSKVEDLFMSLLQQTAEIMLNPTKTKINRKDTIKEEAEDELPIPNAQKTKIVQQITAKQKVVQNINASLSTSSQVVVSNQAAADATATGGTLVLKRQVILEKQKQKKQNLQKKQGCC